MLIPISFLFFLRGVFVALFLYRKSRACGEADYRAEVFGGDLSLHAPPLFLGILVLIQQCSYGRQSCHGGNQRNRPRIAAAPLRCWPSSERTTNPSSRAVCGKQLSACTPPPQPRTAHTVAHRGKHGGFSGSMVTMFSAAGSSTPSALFRQIRRSPLLLRKDTVIPFLLRASTLLRIRWEKLLGVSPSAPAGRSFPAAPWQGR